VVIGAGTVLDAETARAALLNGAQFLVTPVVAEDVVALGRRYAAPVCCGAFTPTEIQRAWQLGAEIVKVFPADVGGPAYLKAIHGPLPQIRLMPTGGVDLETAAAFLNAGACALGVGGSLLSQADLDRRDFSGIQARAAKFAEIARESGSLQ
jgi:2-dehydro-3-deoxyphosphogluconate aldolase/(4S)-4-hydroxy-2-oxoglutarate aldolase